MLEGLGSILDFERFMPHGMCILWDPLLLWTYVVSDVVIWISYFTIPIALTYYLIKRGDTKFNWLLLLFSSFILACGVLHLLEAVTMWTPYYNLVAVVKVITAGVSIATAVAVWPVMPRLLAIPSSQQLATINRLLETDAAAGRANLSKEIQTRLEKDQKIRCLYTITDSIRVNDNLESIMQDIVSALLLAYQSPDIMCARVEIKELVKSSAGFNESINRHHSLIRVKGETVGSIGIGYLLDRNQTRQLINKPSELQLLDTVAQLIGETIERRETAETLHRYELIVSCSSDMLALIDSKYRYLAANPAYLNQFGKLPDELIGQTVSSIVGEAIFESVMKRNIDRCLTGQAVHYQDQFDFPVSGLTYMDVSYSPFYENGKVAGIVVNARDISEVRRIENERERLLSAIEQAAEGVAITDTTGVIEYVNNGFEKITGYTRDEVVGKHTRILKSGKQGESFYTAMWDRLSRGENWNGQLVNRKKDGSLYHEEMVISPVKGASGQTVNYVAVKRDISEEINVEQQLQQAQKMDALGRLAGGIAHDFNNSLGVILGYIDLANEKIEPSATIHTYLTEIRVAAEHSVELTRQLLGFARKQPVSRKVLDFNETVSGMLKMLQRLIGDNIKLNWFPGVGVWQVKMDPSQINQILANLCINARDAIDGIGTISIETSNVNIDEEYGSPYAEVVPGEYVKLVVTDNGCGMDQPTLDKIYEPFFTTKVQGKGTGLGMATIYGIVKQNGGFIHVYSESGRGTTFIIYFRRGIEEDISVLHENQFLVTNPSRETILLVEDEPELLSIITRMLENQGYTVLAASIPDDALRLANEHAGKIDLLITDLMMPLMGGQELAKNITSHNPNIKLLFMSGHLAAEDPGSEVLNGISHFIQKPFNAVNLIAKVQQVMGGF